VPSGTSYLPSRFSKARERSLEFLDAMPTGIIVTVLEIGCISSELFISGFNIFKCTDFLCLSFLSWMTIAVMLAVKKHCLLQTETSPHGLCFPPHSNHFLQPMDKLFFKTLKSSFNPLNAELNPICYLLALLGVHHFLYVSRISD